jgi:NADH:ubiquinone oxidoreductase subunit F (NADH-binding)/NADH:ubiquinone oxidoreductase subunit E
MHQKSNLKNQSVDPEILEVIDSNDRNPEAILEIFQEIQSKRNGLDQKIITDVAEQLNVPARHAYGVATFYSMLSTGPRKPGIIRACNGPVCWLFGASTTRRSLDRSRAGDTAWTVEGSSCLGLCDRAPAILINDEQAGPVVADQVERLTEGHRGQPGDYSTPRPGEKRVMLAKAGLIDPDSIVSALQHGAYCGLGKALAGNPQDVLTEIEASGLTGRGGAGFPVGRKWRFVAQAETTPKYVICNADESEPLIFKDRVLIDTNPHQILEGMAIAGFACSAHEAYIYIRGEYEYQARRLENAIAQAEDKGWLGENIQGAGFSFHIHVHRGAGAYICGEETALIESLEGKRGEPRIRPPYPPTAGYHGLPTLVNNVESYASVPHIMCNGSGWYRSLSEYSTPGTKLYMLLGHINKPGLFEAPFGITLRQAIDEFGGEMRSGSDFQFALTGGAAGTIVAQDLLDVPIDYSSAAKGISLGAGAFLICDQSVDPVDLLRELLQFFAYESCGKCTPCRVGTNRAFEILTELSSSAGQPGQIAELSAIADNLQDASFCGLGQSVAIPIKSALNNFSSEFLESETHINQ